LVYRPTGPPRYHTRIRLPISTDSYAPYALAAALLPGPPSTHPLGRFERSWGPVGTIGHPRSFPASPEPNGLHGPYRLWLEILPGSCCSTCHRYRRTFPATNLQPAQCPRGRLPVSRSLAANAEVRGHGLGFREACISPIGPQDLQPGSDTNETEGTISARGWPERLPLPHEGSRGWKCRS